MGAREIFSLNATGAPNDQMFPNMQQLQGTLKRSFSAEKVPLCEPTLRISNPSKKGTESRLVSELVLISIFTDDQGAFGRKHKSET